MFACKPSEKKLSAQDIIDTCIDVSGANKISNATLTFNFRDKLYSAKRKNGEYNLTRVFTIGNDTIKDILSNSGFERIKNSKRIEVQDSMAVKYSESVNSVHYFSVLPYGLNDIAVKKTLLGEVEIKGKEFYKIKITFSKENGGVDYNDIFIYWIKKDNFKLGYLAYKYNTNEGGMRFREVRKEYFTNGIFFADYDNYEPKNPNVRLNQLDKIFEKKGLKKISEIKLNNINIVFN
ncbi:MAG: DUF6503 family protein [Flavobacteriaceae bacterium]